MLLNEFSEKHQRILSTKCKVPGREVRDLGRADKVNAMVVLNLDDYGKKMQIYLT